MAQFGPATGIDLGTASCTVAVAGNKGVDIICNEVSMKGRRVKRQHTTNPTQLDFYV